MQATAARRRRRFTLTSLICVLNSSTRATEMPRARAKRRLPQTSGRMTRSKTANTAAEAGERHGNVFEALLSGSDDDDGDDSDADEEVEQHYTDCSDCEFDNEGENSYA